MPLVMSSSFGWPTPLLGITGLPIPALVDTPLMMLGHAATPLALVALAALIELALLRWRCALGRGDDLLKFPTIQPNAAAAGTHIEGHAVAAHLRHRSVAVRAHQKRHQVLRTANLGSRDAFSQRKSSCSKVPRMRIESP